MRLRLFDFDALPEPVAWSLVDSVFRCRGSIVTALALCCALGGVGWMSSGNGWYLVNTALTALVALWRMQQIAWYRRARDTAPVTVWARRSLLSGWATACCWAGWSLVLVTEPDLRMASGITAVQAGLIALAAARNSGLLVVAAGQVIIVAGSGAIAWFAMGHGIAVFHGAVYLFFIGAALSLSRDLQKQTLNALFSEHSAHELAEQLCHANEQLALLNENLEEQATTDALTGLANRRAFDRAGPRLWRLAVREARPVCIAMIDVDHFKPFNDNYGHKAGDECLRYIARMLLGAGLRPGDLLARYGGEEFVFLLSGTDEAGGREVGARLLRSLEEEPHRHDWAPCGRVTMSIGIASAVPGPEMALAELLAQADDALYLAKRGGRNRVAALSDAAEEFGATEEPDAPAAADVAGSAPEGLAASFERPAPVTDPSDAAFAGQAALAACDSPALTAI